MDRRRELAEAWEDLICWKCGATIRRGEACTRIVGHEPEVDIIVCLQCRQPDPKP